MWAPWRMEYILSSEEGECLFCDRPRLGKDEEVFILYRSPQSFVMLNRYPYNNAHLLLAPFRHVAAFEDLTDDEISDCFTLAQLCVVILKEELKPHGFNLGMNIGDVAGAGVKAHFHLHIVPRWLGDTSFMPVVASTNVMPQALSETYAKLKRRFDARRNK